MLKYYGWLIFSKRRFSFAYNYNHADKESIRDRFRVVPSQPLSILC